MSEETGSREPVYQFAVAIIGRKDVPGHTRLGHSLTIVETWSEVFAKRDAEQAFRARKSGYEIISTLVEQIGGPTDGR